MTSRCTLYLCTDGSPDALSIENARSLSFSLPRHVRENCYSRHPSSRRVSPPLQPARCAMNRPMLYYGEFIHEICVPLSSLGVNLSPKKGALATRPEKSCPEWERVRLGATVPTSRESRVTHVSRTNSRHVFALNSDALEEMLIRD